MNAVEIEAALSDLAASAFDRGTSTTHLTSRRRPRQRGHPGRLLCDGQSAEALRGRLPRELADVASGRVRVPACHDVAEGCFSLLLCLVPPGPRPSDKDAKQRLPMGTLECSVVEGIFNESGALPDL